ncbi:MAG: transcriptional regulator [Myxococcales bacterium]|nr:MAG: transcriptional regulator [Myxococcales bacterium]
MSIPKSYRTYADFEREEIRPSFKVGFSMEDMVEEATFEIETLDFDRDPFDMLDED